MPNLDQHFDVDVTQLLRSGVNPFLSCFSSIVVFNYMSVCAYALTYGGALRSFQV